MLHFPMMKLFSPFGGTPVHLAGWQRTAIRDAFAHYFEIVNPEAGRLLLSTFIVRTIGHD